MLIPDFEREVHRQMAGMTEIDGPKFNVRGFLLTHFLQTVALPPWDRLLDNAPLSTNAEYWRHVINWMLQRIGHPWFRGLDCIRRPGCCVFPFSGGLC